MEFRFSPEGFRGFGAARKGLPKKLTTPDNSTLFYFCEGFFSKRDLGALKAVPVRFGETDLRK